MAARIRALMPVLPAALRRVADEVLADPEGIARATILELADRSGTSAATVTRFCRALGLEGYGELRLLMAEETGRAAAVAGRDTEEAGNSAPNGHSAAPWVNKLVSLAVTALTGTATALDLAVVDRVAEAVAAAPRVDIYGIGGSGVVAWELQRGLYRVGVPAWSWTEVGAGLTSAALLSPGDVAIGISHSGTTPQTAQMLAAAATQGATTVAITNRLVVDGETPPVVEAADLVLTTAVPGPAEEASGLERLAKRYGQLIAVDLLCTAVASRFERRGEPVTETTGEQDA